MYILTYQDGEAAWFPDLAALLEHIELARNAIATAKGAA